MAKPAESRLCRILAAAVLTVAIATPILRAEPPGPPPPPPPPPGAAAVSKPTAKPEKSLVLPVDASPAADASARPEPPPPPPPKVAIDNWDKDWKNREVDLGPPLPPPDPFEPRHIRYRHDARDVSADGRLKPVKRVPQWVDVIDRAELTEWRPMDIGILARRLPNVQISDGGSPFLQIPNVRGFGGDRVKIMTDGVWPSSQALGFSGGTLSLWDPESTERVEVYHGPGAYLKGLDAPGGVFNIVPRRPRRHGILTADAAVTSSYQSATKTFRERAEADVGTGRIAALIGATWTDVGNRHAADTTVIPSEYNTFAGDLALDYFLDNQSTIGITAQFAKAYDVDAPTGTGSALIQPGYQRTFIALTLSSFDMGSVFHGSRMSIALDSFLSDSDDAFSNTNSGIGANNDVQRFDFHVEGNLYLLPCHETWAELTIGYGHLERTETLLCNARGPAFPKIGQGTDLTGYELWIDDRGPVYADLGACNSVTQQYEAEEFVVSGLLEDQTHDDCWDKHFGLRFDYYHYADTRPGAVSEDAFLFGGAAGVARHFSECFTGFGNASFGWRRPTMFERTANEVIDGKTIIGNANLDPEMHGNLEVGVKTSRKDRASLQAAVFGHYTDDYIAPVDLVPLAANQSQLENRSEAILYGAELTGAWRPKTTIEGWELFGMLGITRSTDDSLVHGLPLGWRAGTRYSVPAPKGYRVRRWFGELAFHGATESRDGPRGDDPYVTADALLGIGIDLGCRKAGTFNLGVLNLFDTQYVPPTSVLPAPGLSLIASLAVNF